ncbi:MAG: hypothetical protein U0984_19920 [Prosthecobacter sp.]|nr:hypothetical protein [Prosthecobacter sp.]
MAKTPQPSKFDDMMRRVIRVKPEPVQGSRKGTGKPAPKKKP